MVPPQPVVPRLPEDEPDWLLAGFAPHILLPPSVDALSGPMPQLFPVVLPVSFILSVEPPNDEPAPQPMEEEAFCAAGRPDELLKLSPKLDMAAAAAPGLLELDITDPDLAEAVSKSSRFEPVSELSQPIVGQASLSFLSTTSESEDGREVGGPQGDGLAPMGVVVLGVVTPPTPPPPQPRSFVVAVVVVAVVASPRVAAAESGPLPYVKDKETKYG